MTRKAPGFTVPPLVLHDSRKSGCSLQEICSYKYVLSLPGIGYANRLKQLLLCNSTVIHVDYKSREWFMPLLNHDAHLVQVPAAD